MSSFDISVAESHVRKAENDVEYYKRALDEAKRNGNYKNQRKSYRHSNGKVGNSYDCNYWSAQDELKKAKQHLKDVKERDRDERKAEKAKEKEAREKEKAERSSSKSTSSSSSSSYNSYRDDDDDDNYTSSYSSSSYSDDDDSDYSPTYSSYTPSYSSSPSWLVTLLLCLFFGGFGAHRFYVGKKTTGLIQLFTCGGFAIWYMIDLVMIFFGAFKDSDGDYIRPGRR